MWEMDSTLPATLSRMGWFLYRAFIRFMNTRQSGLSSIMPISWPMMPCSLSTLSWVNQGMDTKERRIFRLSQNFSVLSK